MSLHVSVRDKSFRKDGTVTQVLSDVDFAVPASSITCLYGPSGCGKSTLLRIIAGLETDYYGSIELNGRPVTHPTKDVGMTVQAYVSYDWLTVAENITFGLRYSRQQSNNGWLRRLSGKVDPALVSVEAERLAKIVGLSQPDLAKYPEEISGGMKQRMAFARALLANPQVLLLDEPFSSLDFESRQSLQDVVLRVRDELGTAFVCVSHDPEEVLYIADEVLVLSGTPATIIHRARPKLPHHGTGEKRYTQEFQLAKKELQSWLTPPEGTTR